jgi:bacteriocin biosynthesis cyclodehydratase domain-containing protein
VATAVRLEGSPHLAPTATTALVGVGPFGAAVTRVLSRSTPDSQRVETSDMGRAFADHGLVVLVSGRLSPTEYETADAASAALSRPWLPAVLEGDRIRVGPVVAPGRGPCFQCYLRRRDQHDVNRATSALLRDHYAQNPEAAPGGFLPHHVSLAAGMTSAVLGALRDSTGPALSRLSGQVFTMGTHDCTIRRDHVVALHGCIRCGKGQPAESPELQRILRFAHRPVRAGSPGERKPW